MFGKVVKHEFKSTYSIFLQMFAGMLFITLLTMMMIKFVSNKRQEEYGYGFMNGAFSFSIGLWITVFFAVNVVSFVLIVRRFYVSMVGKGAYLTYGLPVSATSLVGGKFLVAMIWNIFTNIVTFLSLTMVAFTILFTLPSEVFNWEEFQMELGNIKGVYFEEYSAIIRFLVTLLFLSLIYEVYGIISWYFAAVIGMQARKHKILTMLLTVLGLTLVMQTVVGILMASDNARFFFSMQVETESLPSFVSMIDFQREMLLKSGVISLVTSILLFVITANMVRHKPNIT